MLFGLYVTGFALVISGFTYGAHLLHMPTQWIVICAVVVLGASFVSCCSTDEQPEFPDEDCNR
jgi:hypothetical protein